MIPRTLQLPTDEHLLLFGPRGVGKTTYLKALPFFDQSIYINLLMAEHENRFSRKPDDLIDIAKAADSCNQPIIIDEVQKIPKLLDIVHEIIESDQLNIKFILTGSSARKLKHGGANLLAGRAFVYHLAPFIFTEVDTLTDIHSALRWGMLPKLFEYNSDDKRQKYLETYVNTYLKEEIWVEQFIRNLDPFRHFLEVSAQSNGKIINFSNIARDVGVNHTTVTKYYSILEDTLLGFFLPPFQHSFRKRLSKAPKFFYFDPGVVRALSRRLSVPLTSGTSGFGDAFEHFIILQCYYLAQYHHSEYRFSYFKTKDDAEIDLVVERPGMSPLFIEIKSAEHVDHAQLNTLKRLSHDFGDCEAVCFSRDPYPRESDEMLILPWREGVLRYFGTPNPQQ
jgi:predicted AAA+ superfamily ATPase